jgi:hypothetical protein
MTAIYKGFSDRWLEACEQLSSYEEFGARTELSHAVILPLSRPVEGPEAEKNRRGMPMCVVRGHIYRFRRSAVKHIFGQIWLADQNSLSIYSA